MSVPNKTTLEQANAAITAGDYEGFLVHCTDDTEQQNVLRNYY